MKKLGCNDAGDVNRPAASCPGNRRRREASAASPSPASPAVNCAAQDEAAEYCAHVHDPCCGSDFQGWVCDNACYVDWFAAQCPRR